MKETFPSFVLRIDHLLASESGERKQKKEGQLRDACLEVSKLDDPIGGTQAKTTKYVTKYAVNVFQGNFGV